MTVFIIVIDLVEQMIHSFELQKDDGIMIRSFDTNASRAQNKCGEGQ